MRICLLKASPQADPCFNKLTVQGGRIKGTLVEVGEQVGNAVRMDAFGRSQREECEGRAVQVICCTDYPQISCKARITSQVLIPMPALQPSKYIAPGKTGIRALQDEQ